MKSLRRSLYWTGKIPPIRIPSGLQTHPKSLKEIMRILSLPKPKIETLEKRKVVDFAENDAQGLAYAYGDIWLLSSAERIFRYSIQGSDLYRPSVRRLKPTRELSDLVAELPVQEGSYDHIGDIDFFNGLVFAPLRRSNERPPHLLLALSGNLEIVGYSALPLDTGESWCAVNPWNGLLYMPNCNDDRSLNLYDISEFYTTLHNRTEWGKCVKIDFLGNYWFYKIGDTVASVPAIQGIAFSQNGRLYVTRYIEQTVKYWWNYINIYDTMTGKELARPHEDINFTDFRDEIEGISIHPSGIIYVAVAINQARTDRFQIYAFKYSDTSFPV